VGYATYFESRFILKAGKMRVSYGNCTVPGSDDIINGDIDG